MTTTMLHPQLSSLVNAGVVVESGVFERDYGKGGIRPNELEDAYIFAELSRECGLLDEEEAFWEQVDEIELSLGETAESLNWKNQQEVDFLESMYHWMSDSGTDFLDEDLRSLEKQEEDCILDTASPGYKMMKAMGWVNNTPLGCRGTGILEPVSTMIKMRLPGDFSGLGYERADPIVNGEKEETKVKIIRVEENYGVGKCERGGVFIPRGALKHIKNLMGGNLIGKSFTGKLISKEGKYEWRVCSVV